MNDLPQLDYHLADFVATLTLNAPPVNALTRTLNDKLTLALDRISEMDDIRVVVLTGAGKVFCAGADLKGRAENITGPGDLPAHSRRTRERFHAIRERAGRPAGGPGARGGAFPPQPRGPKAGGRRDQRCRARLGAGDGGVGRRA